MVGDPYLLGLAEIAAKGGELTPEQRVALETHYGPGLTATHYGEIAVNNYSRDDYNNARGGGGGSPGDVYAAPASIESMTDRDLAQVGSTVSDNDIARAEMLARQGEVEAAQNVAGNAGGLNEDLERAELAQAGADYMMNARAGESVSQYEDRKQQEAKENNKSEGIGSMVAGFFTGAMALAGLKKATDAITGNLTPQDDMAAKHEGFMLVAGNQNSVQGYRDFGSEPVVDAGIDEGIARAASLGNAMGQQTTVARADAGGGRSLNG